MAAVETGSWRIFETRGGKGSLHEITSRGLTIGRHADADIIVHVSSINKWLSMRVYVRQFPGCSQGLWINVMHASSGTRSTSVTQYVIWTRSMACVASICHDDVMLLYLYIPTCRLSLTRSLWEERTTYWKTVIPWGLDMVGVPSSHVTSTYICAWIWHHIHVIHRYGTDISSGARSASSTHLPAHDRYCYTDFFTTRRDSTHHTGNLHNYIPCSNNTVAKLGKKILTACCGGWCFDTAHFWHTECYKISWVMHLVSKQETETGYPDLLKTWTKNCKLDKRREIR